MTKISVQTVLLYILLGASQSASKWLPMIPDGSHQVITAGANLVLSCIYQYRDEYDTSFGDVWWTLPDYVEKNPVIQHLNVRLIFRIVNNSFYLCRLVIFTPALAKLSIGTKHTRHRHLSYSESGIQTLVFMVVCKVVGVKRKSSNTSMFTVSTKISYK